LMYLRPDDQFRTRLALFFVGRESSQRPIIMSARARIDAYFDCNSPWSYFAFTYLRRNRQALAAHNVDVEFHPIFLGGLNVGSGNKPPFTVPAKANHGKFDTARATKYFKTPALKPPSFFPILSIFPMRCMLYIKDNYPAEQFEAQFYELWQSYWFDHIDLSKPEGMSASLSRNFKEDDIAKIVQGGSDPHYKKLLTNETSALVAKGAYGAPWFRVTNKAGAEEPFFGSDRFHFMFQFLDIPFQDIAILPPSKL